MGNPEKLMSILPCGRTVLGSNGDSAVDCTASLQFNVTRKQLLMMTNTVMKRKESSKIVNGKVNGKNGITEVYAQNQQKLNTFWDTFKINGNSYEVNALPLAAIEYH